MARTGVGPASGGVDGTTVRALLVLAVALAVPVASAADDPAYLRSNAQLAKAVPHYPRARVLVEEDRRRGRKRPVRGRPADLVPGAAADAGRGDALLRPKARTALAPPGCLLRVGHAPRRLARLDAPAPSRRARRQPRLAQVLRARRHPGRPARRRIPVLLGGASETRQPPTHATFRRLGRMGTPRSGATYPKH